MDIETKIELVKRKPTEEVVTDEGLKEMFENYEHPRHYIGFEISGKVHIGSGLCTALKIRDFIKAGIKPTIFLADYHSWINEKMGGDLENIRKIGNGYFKHAFISLGLTEDKVDYVLASDVYDKDYWPEVLKVVKDTTIKRMLRCVTIMGRKESDSLKSSAILYPAMQAADIFKLDIQLAHAGMDQRKVHMLAWEAARKQGRKFVSVHGHLLPGLQGVQRMNPTEDEAIDAKMSKSIPDSAIFIHDSEADIKRKINKAHCPEKIVEGNPVIEYAEYLVLRDQPLKIERPEKFGGDLEIQNTEELKKVYSEGKLHPADLKNGVATMLAEILAPSRKYFEKNKHYLEDIEKATITR
ncbi:tyrosine--tRNA ligase [Candidatus Micrarchaeota archaeon]|nr:tyrosine--tRNA ligase [Candidatus Micrarchaeota archaeon]MBU1166503.1 tyrosine--tRNA ligase [Candidatus Micrarchaeota archaeon]MBU1887515.1 tyrosine--tRNA ligase [Candidatus Micrarchaeota archaeon]